MACELYHIKDNTRGTDVHISCYTTARHRNPCDVKPLKRVMTIWFSPLFSFTDDQLIVKTLYIRSSTQNLPFVTWCSVVIIHTAAEYLIYQLIHFWPQFFSRQLPGCYFSGKNPMVVVSSDCDSEIHTESSNIDSLHLTACLSWASQPHLINWHWFKMQGNLKGEKQGRWAGIDQGGNDSTVQI